ncbi:MAG: hypothetical protein ABI727_05695 [Nitrosospira sp.]
MIDYWSGKQTVQMSYRRIPVSMAYKAYCVRIRFWVKPGMTKFLVFSGPINAYDKTIVVGGLTIRRA